MHYKEDIKELKNFIYKTGILVEEMLRIALEVLFNKDEEKRYKINRKYAKIVNNQTIIEDKATHLIPLSYLNEDALRDILSLIKISVHLERIAARCKHIAVTEISSLPAKKIKSEFQRMRAITEKSIEMFINVLRAYKNEDAQSARNIAEKGYEITDHYHRFNIRITYEIMNNPNDTEEFLKFIYLNRDIERLSEHLKIICEWIYFDVTGEHLNFKNNVSYELK